MSSFLTLDSLSLATPDGARTLVDDLTLAFGRERTGVVGRNGSGKSTLLHVMAGLVAPQSGTISRSGSVGLLRQDWPDPSASADAALGLAPALERLRRITEGQGDEVDFAEADWTLEERLDAALAEAGFARADLARPIASFSGGERTRLAVTQILLDAPDLLLLDEPSNNLDAAGQELIARLIANWRGGVVLASHDRMLLEQMDRIVELTSLGATVFGGGWSAWEAARDAARDRAASELDRADRALRQAEREVQEQRERKARRDRAGKAAAMRGGAPKIVLGAMQRRAEASGGREKLLGDRLVGDAQAGAEQARRQVERLTPLRIELPESGLSSDRRLVTFDHVELERDGRRLFRPLSFELRGPERVLLSGPNGAGKTSLLGLIRGTIAPTAGTVRALRERIALLDQHVGILDPAASILDNLRRLHPELGINEAYAALARFAFRNQAASRIVGSLSGGERLRAGLACALSSPEPPQLLLLDEPTNHLDMESVEILEEALAEWDGALLVVSHDRAFVDALGLTRELALGSPLIG